MESSLVGRISLIGMSGCGKTVISSKLEREAAWRAFHCDDLISSKLKPTLTQGLSETAALSAWMGQPYSKGFRQRQQIYLDTERSVVNESLAQISASDSAQHPCVLDTTGSVIYLGDDIAQQLRAATTVVYLKVAASEQDRMLEQYFRDPKPVVWADLYQPLSGEDPERALRRCYSELCRWRAAQYERWAHVVIPVSIESLAEISANSFLESVKGR